jgi:peroxiredoxin
MIFGVYGYWQYYNSQLPPVIGGNSNTSPPTSDLAPTFSLKDVNGTQFSLSQQNGKVVAVHFMAVGCSGQIYTINDHQLSQLKTLCNTYCGKKPFTIVTVAVATCPNSQLTSIRSSYGITWILGNDYDDQTLDIVNAYKDYSIRDGTIVLIDKTLHVAKVYTEELATDTVKNKIDQLLEA